MLIEKYSNNMRNSLIILLFSLLIHCGHNCRSKTKHEDFLNTQSPNKGEIEVDEDSGPVIKLKVLNTQEGHENFGKFSVVEMMPSKIKIEANIVDFILMTSPFPGEDIKSSTPNKILERKEFINNSPSELTEHFEFKFNTYNSRTFTFMQNLKTLANFKIESSLPFIGKAEVTGGLEAQLQATQEFKIHDEKEEIQKRLIKVPPFSTVDVTASYEIIKDVNVPFEVTIHITGCGKLTDNVTGEITTRDGPIPAEFLEFVLRDRGFQADIEEYKENILVVRSQGHMSGTLSKGVILLNGKSLLNDETDNNNSPNQPDPIINVIHTTPRNLVSFFPNDVMNYAIIVVITATVLVLIFVATWKVHRKYKKVPAGTDAVENSYDEKFL